MKSGFVVSGKMAQQVEELATLLDDLSSSHRTHVVEGENLCLQVVLWPLRRHSYLHPHTINK